MGFNAGAHFSAVTFFTPAPVIPVLGADQGLSLSGTNVQLGQAVGAVGNPAQINADREIPFDLFTNLNILTTAFSAAALQLQISPIQIRWGFDSTLAQPHLAMVDSASGDSWDLFYDPAAATFFWGGGGINVTCEGFALFNIGGGSATPTAQLEVGGGGGGAGQGQLKFRGPTLLAAPENGVMEYNGVNIFFTRAGAVRENMLTGNAGAAAPALNVAGVPANFYGINGVNYLGDPNNWTQVNIGGVNFKIPLYL